MARQYSDNLTLGSLSGASGVSGKVDVDGYNSCRILVNVTALGAGTTLTITAQDTNDTTYTVWYTHTAMTGITATGQYSLSLTNLSRFVRLSWTMASGTTTATVAVSMSLDQHA